MPTGPTAPPTALAAGFASLALRHRGWGRPLAATVLGALALAFALVVLDARRQGEQRRRAAAALEAAVAGCEALRTHQERTRCRAGLQPLPRDNAALAGWAPRSP